MTRLLALLACVLMSGCALLQPSGAPPPLIAPAAYAARKTLWQQVRISRAGHRQTYTAVLNIRPARIKMTWFGPLGARLLNLQWDGQKLRSQGPATLTPPLTPRWLIADMQTVYAPRAALNAALSGSAWRVTQASAGTRQLIRNTKPVVRVFFHRQAGAKVTIQHLNWQTRIDIQSRKVSDNGESSQ